VSLQAEADVGAGVGPLSVEILAGLKASFDGLTSEMRKRRQLEEAYQFGAVEVALRGSGMSDSGGDTLIIDLSGPTYGRLWQVRRVTVGGPLWTTSVGGSVLFVVSSNQPSAAPPLSDIADEAATLPTNGFYSTGQFVVRHPNHLFVLILSPDESKGYAAGGAATDFPDKRQPITTPD